MRIYKSVIFLLITILLVSCSVSKRVERRGGYLLTRNIIKTDRSGLSQSDLLNFSQPKPNKKFLGLFRSRVWIWDAFGHNPKRKINRWVTRNFGEPPVLLDTLLVYNSLAPMKQYLWNKGYFNATIQSRVELKNGKAKVIYSTSTEEPWKFGKISREINDDTIKKIVFGAGSASIVKEGEQYDAYNMTAERDRITQILRNSGYYAFNSDYIYYEVDTSKENKTADIKLIIQNRIPVDKQRLSDDESFVNKSFHHKRYIINNLYINTDYPRVDDTTRNFDTISFIKDSSALVNKQIPDFYQIYRNHIKIKPNALSRAVFIVPGSFYSQRGINLTYNRMQNLGISSYVSVNVRPPQDTVILRKDVELLDCEIRIVRAKVNSFTIEAEGTNVEGMMGLGSSISYLNRNIFKGAEALRIKAFGSFEVKPRLTNEEDDELLAVFNSLETGLETGLDFPTLLSPISISNLDINARPRTTLGLGFNYELRDLYERYLAKFSLSYEWNSSPLSRHFFSPLDLSSVSIVRDSLFNDILQNLQDPRFLNQYTNHLILALKYSYVFNNQNLTNRKNFFYFRINFEPAGNLFNLVSNVTNAPRDENGKFKLFGLRYAQYFRSDFDFRYYEPISAHRRLVYRVAYGIGIPYGNSISLPFEKGFFAGGANGMRGWPLRSLGPGQYKSEDGNVLKNVGDMSFEGNIEYRFPIYRFINGALFTDIGNIWLIEENTDFPGGSFSWKNAIKSLGADIGMGFRFDFSLFIFRIDGGIRMHDPAKNLSSRFFNPAKFQLKDVNWNFGIGYPF